MAVGDRFSLKIRAKSPISARGLARWCLRERRPLETEVKTGNGNSYNRHFDEKRQKMA